MNNLNLQKSMDSTSDKLLINKVLLSWKAPDRIAYNRDAMRTSGLGAIVLLVAIYLVWVGQPLLAVVVLAIFFFYYIIATIPPITVEHRIESYGIRTLGKLYPWENLRQFWFAELDGHIVMLVDTTLNIPARLFFIVDDYELAQKLVKIVAKYIPYKVLPKKQGFWSKLLEGEYMSLEDILPPEEIYTPEALEAVKAGNKASNKGQQAEKKRVSKTRSTKSNNGKRKKNK